MAAIRLKLSPPWVTYANMLIKLFGQDPDIKIKYDENQGVLKLFVENDEKAVLLSKFLPCVKKFGNITLGVDVIPANKKLDYNFGDEVSIKDAFDIIFKNNPVYSFSYEVKGLFNNSIIYVVFVKEVVQFFNDNLNDIYGNVNTLYQTIAETIFEDCSYDLHNVFYCTASDIAATTEWP